MRRCASCGIVKDVDEFPPRKDRPSGRMSRCRDCDRKRAADYYRRNRVRVLERQAARRKADRP